MIIDGKHINIINAAIAYESGIIWRSANKRVEPTDYGIETDHLSAKISVWGAKQEIAGAREFAIPRLSSRMELIFNQSEKPFGPIFDTEGLNKYTLINVGNIITENMGIAQTSFQIAYSLENLAWASESIPFDLRNFAVQEIRRESEENSVVHQKESSWAIFGHGWKKSEFTLSLLAHSQIMAGSIRWLLTDCRAAEFSIDCNASMSLINSQSENVYCTSFGNLHRLGNSGMWQVDFNFTRFYNADDI